VLRAKTASVLVIIGAALSALGLILGLGTARLVVGGQTVAGGDLHGTIGTAVGCVLLIAAAGVLAWPGTRRLGIVLAIVGGALVVFTASVELARSYGLELFDLSEGPVPEEELRAQLTHLIEQGAATIEVSRSFGSFLFLGGGLAGLAGGVVALLARRSTPPLPPPPAA
jgi:hypothetical protein